jgi:hypothetical protein
MASTPEIANFDATKVRAGLRLAMQVGLPVMAGDQPTFFMPTTVTADGAHTLDQRGTPFDPAYRPTRAQPAGIQVPCGMDYKDAAGNLVAAGSVSATGIVLTLLDEDYAQVKGFAYVVIAGVKYNYQRTDRPQGLVSVGIYTVHVLADDEG